MEKSALSVDFAFLCDDVRQEGNGKFIFIGVYNESINLQDTGVDLSLQMVSSLRNAGEQTYQFELRVLFDGESKMDLEGEITSAKSGASFIPFPIMVKEIEASGVLTIDFREKGLEWGNVITVPIQISSDN